jgi:hypothetical protein
VVASAGWGPFGKGKDSETQEEGVPDEGVTTAEESSVGEA